MAARNRRPFYRLDDDRTRSISAFHLSRTFRNRRKRDIQHTHAEESCSCKSLTSEHCACDKRRIPETRENAIWNEFETQPFSNVEPASTGINST